METLREARREDVPEIVALLADDAMGAGREGPADDAYYAAFDLIAADPRTSCWSPRRPGASSGPCS